MPSCFFPYTLISPIFSFCLYLDDHEEQTWSPPPHILFNMRLITNFGWLVHSEDENADYDSWCIRLLTHFRFPNLRHLDWKTMAPSNLPSTQTFFTSMQRLEYLMFYPSLTSCISQYFHIFENLKILDVKLGWEAEYDEQWLQKLIITPGNEILFPHLQGLHIISYLDATPCSVLIAILYSRRHGPLPQKSLEPDLDSLTLPPCVGSSAELEYHSRLVEFSYKLISPKESDKIDWASSSHYGALKNLVSEAKEVYGGLDHVQIKLVFES
ncbi:hypothetical protein AGABI2DRAFT_122095 [Agaricus bisporus var. bisporus H97]|uniref:hypothetical protein n=1 Tax=Agaricus bisporus var. bisporus (strain H97 / ATCC MYA-4626 / FGSC 10389) TaxID=936046 RepID=UPI00029F6802|nr:hypothetical protein AGABI2DRAFT_122095 [Agaricus bisporus var. bisporus H97]EKV43184.1 hypothetical protein AGABI2DRAFT_122095 [Agaricus bisporus var. bisporus H97]